MYRLEKNGVVRETGSRITANHFLKQGYTEVLGAQPGYATGGLSEKTMQELYELCKATGIEIPKGTKKDGLVELLAREGQADAGQ